MQYNTAKMNINLEYLCIATKAANKETHSKIVYRNSPIEPISNDVVEEGSPSSSILYQSCKVRLNSTVSIPNYNRNNNSTYNIKYIFKPLQIDNSIEMRLPSIQRSSAEFHPDRLKFCLPHREDYPPS